jgi:hypothetical protein
VTGSDVTRPVAASGGVGLEAVASRAGTGPIRGGASPPFGVADDVAELDNSSDRLGAFSHRRVVNSDIDLDDGSP